MCQDGARLLERAVMALSSLQRSLHTPPAPVTLSCAFLAKSEKQEEHLSSARRSKQENDVIKQEARRSPFMMAMRSTLHR